MQLGMVGLGRMGSGMRDRLRRDGHEVVGYDVAPERRDVDSLEALTRALGTPRTVWVMVPAGDPTAGVVRHLATALGEGDLVVDGGNSFFRDSQRHARELGEQGIGFVDVGVSGGVWGLENGFGLMAGGADADIGRLRPVLASLAPPDGWSHAGRVGAGHFSKMVHNGIEYGLMEAYAEGFQLLSSAAADEDLAVDVAQVMSAWRHGTVIRSWLLDLFAEALVENPGLKGIRGWADDSGEGRWTVDEAVKRAVPAPAIAAALFARFSSRQEESGGHAGHRGHAQRLRRARHSEAVGHGRDGSRGGVRGAPTASGRRSVRLVAQPSPTGVVPNISVRRPTS